MKGLRVLLRRQVYRALSSGARGSSSPSLLTAELRAHLRKLVEEYDGLQDRTASLSGDQHHKLYQQIATLEPVVKMVRQLEGKEQEMKGLEELLESAELEENQGEGGMKALVLEEKHSCHGDLQEIQKGIIQALIPRDAADHHSAILEVRAGAGGKEASLFAAEIFQMYHKFAVHKYWKFEVLEAVESDTGGYKYASGSVTGKGVFGMLKHESGVHRVQRVPVTEGAGRIHTSTMSVAILPQPSEIEVDISPNDLRVETHRSSGPGGQSVNTTDSAVRLTHIPTGLVVHIQDDRSQHKNRAKALKILRARLYEKKRMEHDSTQRKERKEQIGSGERHERIRTYHFLQDRVTDHRLGVTIHGTEDFLQGGEKLQSLVEQLQAAEEARAINRLLTSNYKH